MYSSEPLHHFVEQYLAYLHETYPTDAALDGVHLHDDLLEDLSRQAIDAQIRSLAGFSRRLDQIRLEGLTPTEQVEHPVAASSIRSRLFELEEVRSWERSPQYYAGLLASSLAAQVVFDYAPVEERARRILSKLRQVPRFVGSARDNIKEPPGIFVKVGLETLRGVLKFVETDLPKALTDVDDLHLLGDLADASMEAADALRSYIDYLEREVAPRARASFRLGREKFEQKLKLDEGIGLNSDRLQSIVLRALGETAEEFRRTAGRLGPGDPIENWRGIKRRHPPAGGLVEEARRQIDELRTFIERQDLVSIPDEQPVIVAPTPDFYRWSFASMWTPGPFESRRPRAYYFVTDVEPSWPPERQEEHLLDFNYQTLWAISMHEVYPGHFVQYQHMRGVEAKLRKSVLFAPTSFVEGWAHYGEQMMIEAGFGREDPAIRLGQLAEVLIRLVRAVVSIRLHAEDMSVEQGVRLFRDEAYMEESSARREAERGTFDPAYGVYALGRLMFVKLRADYKAAQEARFSPRAFHDAVLSQGSVPLWALRQLLLGRHSGDILE
ncbi:MAG: DUF885 domain-containing protein [Vicinamibacterales bacterium]